MGTCERICWRAHPEWGAEANGGDARKGSGRGCSRSRWFDMPEESRVLGAEILLACGYPVSFYIDEDGSVDLSEDADRGISPSSWFHAGESVFRPHPRTYGRDALFAAAAALERAREVAWGENFRIPNIPLPVEFVCMSPSDASVVLGNGKARLEETAEKYLRRFSDSAEPSVFGAILLGEDVDCRDVYRIEIFAAAKHLAVLAFGASLVSPVGGFVSSMADAAVEMVERMMSGECDEDEDRRKKPGWSDISRNMPFSENGLFCSLPEALVLVAMRAMEDGVMCGPGAFARCAGLHAVLAGGEEAGVPEEALDKFTAVLESAAVEVEETWTWGGGVVL